MNNNSPNSYIDKVILEELNYKIWSTKESRLNAKKRLIEQSRKSTFCHRILSLYFIIAALYFIYNLLKGNSIHQSLIVTSIIVFYFILLIFDWIEEKKNYALQAQVFQNCGSELSNLYNLLCIFKTFIIKQPLENKIDFAEKVAKKYQKIVETHPHHETIDTDVFKLKAVKYHELKFWDIQAIKINYYLKTTLLYHVLIILPPLILFIIIK